MARHVHRPPALVVLVAILAAGCSRPIATPPSTPQEQTASACGIERWAVKTLTDPDSGGVNLTPKTAIVEDLVALPVPEGFGRDVERLAPEFQTYMVAATLVEFKEETDNDIHLVIMGESGHPMIAEIPHPDCAQGSRVLPQITRVREQFISKFGQPSRSSWLEVNEPIRLTGVLFFDVPHGQRGVAPNAIELHPVIEIGP